MRLWSLFKRFWLKRDTWQDYPLRTFELEEVCRVPLAPYLNKYGRPKLAEPGYLQLRLNAGSGFGDGLIPRHFYADAQYSFELEWQPKFRMGPVPVAIVSFNINYFGTHSCVVVRQLQGVRHKAEYLADVRWERLLLHVVTDWASANDFGSVACIRGRDSAWCGGREEKFKMRYDVTARRSGFRYVPRQMLWMRQLPVPPLS